MAGFIRLYLFRFLLFLRYRGILCHGSTFRQTFFAAVAPVILICSFAPALLELLYALLQRIRIVEIPLPLAHGRYALVLGSALCGGRLVLALCGFCGLAFLGLFLFLLLQGFNHTVNGRIASLFIHLCQCLQAVLQMNGRQMRSQLLQHIAAVLHFFIEVMFLVQHTHAGHISAGGFYVVLAFPVDLAQSEQQHRLGSGALDALFHTLFIGSDGTGRVLCAHVDVAHRIIDLILVVLVLLALGHSAKLADHLSGAVARNSLCLFDLGIECQFIRRVAADYAPVGLVGHVQVASLVIQLPQQEFQAGALQFSLGILDAAFQIRDGLLVLSGLYQKGSLGLLLFPQRLYGETVPRHLGEHVLRIVWPFHCHIAAGQQRTRHIGHFGLCGIQTHDVSTGAGAFHKIALAELAFRHQQPGTVKEGVELLA